MNTIAFTEIGPMLRRARESAGMSQEKLAEATGYSLTYISLIETGARTATATAVSRIFNKLGFHVAYAIWPQADGDGGSKDERDLSGNQSGDGEG